MSGGGWCASTANSVIRSKVEYDLLSVECEYRIYQVHVELLLSPENSQEYDWSFGQPEDVNMNVGTYCSVLSETRRRSMFQYLFEEARTRFRAVKLRME